MVQQIPATELPSEVRRLNALERAYVDLLDVSEPWRTISCQPALCILRDAVADITQEDPEQVQDRNEASQRNRQAARLEFNHHRFTNNLPSAFSGEESPEFKSAYLKMRSFLDAPGDGANGPHALIVGAYVAVQEKLDDQSHDLIASAVVYHGGDGAVEALERAIKDHRRWSSLIQEHLSEQKNG